jgi:ATP-binding cassette subfamily B protein
MLTAFKSDLFFCRRLISEARAYWFEILGILFFGLLATPFSLLTPLPLKIVVDSVINSNPVPSFLYWMPPAAGEISRSGILLIAIGLEIAIALLTHLQILGHWLLQTYTGEKLVLDFRAKIFRHVQRLSLCYHDRKGTADSIYRIQQDASAIQEIIVYGFVPLVTSFVNLVAMVYVIALIDWQLAVIALAVSPIYCFLILIYGNPLRNRWNAVTKLESSALSVVQEVLTSVRVVKSFGQEDVEKDRYVRCANDSMWARLRAAFVESHFGLFVGLTTAIGIAAVLFIGIKHVQSGLLTLGDLLLVMGYLSQLYGPVKTISHKAAGLQPQIVRVGRAFMVLDEAPDVPEKPNARSIQRAVGAVAFQNVSFDYGQSRPVIQRVSFEVMPGTRLGIVGATGAGKSTLVNLLTRFYDPCEGRILLDGIDLRNYKIANLRSQFAVVLQEPVLFSTTILENIAYARPAATKAEIIDAAKAADVHNSILRLPAGYDTFVGERGMTLSGGERQRVSLARAFLRDAPILILDEPTSSVDLETESVIMEAMERLMRGRTTFLISHRDSTLRNCDMIVEVSNGRVSNLAQ